ncbi:MAG: histidine kinase [Desulfuromonas sp.]|nr:MAG: histidine kinase [Desulfuromonas sp.]
MEKMTDQQLIEELRERFDMNRRALQDLQTMTRKLESVNNKLQDSEALKSQFLSNIRNEINNPLSSIMGLSRQLMDSSIKDPAKAASIIHAEAFSLDFQLRNIFIAAELEAGEAEPSVSRTDIAGLVDGTLDLFRYLADEKKLKIDTQVPDELLFVTDAEKLQIVLNNLVANAIEFSLEGGKISVVAQCSDGQLILEVIDSGIGIAPEHQEKVFDRFRQVESGSTKGHRGHGLGLSIIRAACDLLGGNVELESDLGKGCRFSLTLPEIESEMTDVLAKDGNFFLFDEGEKY